MITFSNQRWDRLAAIGAIVAALAVSGCGRKGPLDPPPAAAVQPAPEQQGAPVPEVLQPTRPGVSQSDISLGRDAGSTATAPPPTGRNNQPFFLDWLLN